MLYIVIKDNIYKNSTDSVVEKRLDVSKQSKKHIYINPGGLDYLNSTHLIQ